MLELLDNAIENHDLRSAVLELPSPVNLRYTSRGRWVQKCDPIGTMSLSLCSGLWKMALTARGIPFLEVAASTWQAEMLRGSPGATTKDRAIWLAGQLWPDLDLLPGRFTTPQDGIADAALIAEWGRRRRTSAG